MTALFKIKITLPQRTAPFVRLVKNGLLAFIGLAAITSVAALAESSSLQSSALNFEPCHLEGLAEQVECANYQVPEDYQQPDGNQLELFVVRLAAVSSGAEKDPIFFLAGGPGQAASEIAIIMSRIFNEARQTRDLIFIDQRGTGRSNPLSCETKVEAIWELLKLEDDEQDFSQEIEDCIPTDVSVQNFSTLNAVHDFERVRIALGYPQVNLYGGSYGTRSGLIYMKTYPESIRSAVLDGLAPPQITLGLFATQASKAFEQIFVDCELQAGCQAAFPHLKDTYIALKARLAEKSELIQERDSRSYRLTEIRMTLNRLYQGLFPALYHPSSRRLIPYVLAQASEGNYKPLLGLAGPFDAEPSLYTGLMLSVLCQEDVPLITAEEAALEESAIFLGDMSLRNLQALCQKWPVAWQDESSKEPVVSSIPTLLLSGDQDPVTPPAWGELAAEGLSQATHLVAKHAGHTIASHTCANKLASQFFANPQAELDASCLENRKPLPFVTHVNASSQ